mmetsp:Transcript_98882/g.249704  ORF Transcript_98882/g.249704 Transcript_98882/m.249704 type:complete len:98 (-) Transcript_98882:32-325(-)
MHTASTKAVVGCLVTAMFTVFMACPTSAYKDGGAVVCMAIGWNSTCAGQHHRGVRANLQKPMAGPIELANFFVLTIRVRLEHCFTFAVPQKILPRGA